MLSKRTWAALAAGMGIGLFIAGTLIAGWWYFDARYQPVQLSADDEFVALIEDAPYVALNDAERPVYVIGPRDLAMVESWLGEDARRLDRLGREVRAIMVPSGYSDHAEEATIAQLWLRPDYRLLRDWFARPAELWTAAGLPSVRRDPARQDALAAANGFANRMAELTGAGGRWPLLVWRDPTGALSLCICDNPQSQARARAILGLDRMGGVENDPALQEGAPYKEPDYEEDERGDNYAYPQSSDGWSNEDTLRGYDDMSSIGDTGFQSRGAIVPPPLLPGDPAYSQEPQRPSVTAPSEEPRRAAVTTARAQSRPVPKPAPATPPQATKDAESLFY